MLSMDLKKLAELLQGTQRGENVQVQGVAIDSRVVSKGQCFFAIKGARVDPHDYAQQIKAAGAAAMVVERALDIDIPQVIVENSYQALGILAAYWRDQFPIEFIAVTGSNGKTTVKNMISAILIAATGDEAAVLYSHGNLNSGFGLPLTLARLNAQHRVGVLEMGMSSLGEIDYITRIAKPKVALINNVFPCHVEFLGSLLGVARAKSEIFKGLTENGIAVLDKESEFFALCAEAAKPHAILTFGFDVTSDVYATDIQGQSFMLHTPNGEARVHLPLLGLHNIKNALASAACAHAYGIKLEAIVRGLQAVQAEKGRLQLYQFPQDIRVINDAYNANPASTRAAIKVLSTQPGETILVLGDMRELGEDEVLFHREIGEYAKAQGIQTFYAVGVLMQHAVSAFGPGARHFPDKDSLMAHVKTHLHAHQSILFKASLSMGLLACVQQCMEFISGL